MANQPSFADLGGVPVVAGARPVGRYDLAPLARGAQAIAEAGTRFGQSIGNLGEAAYAAGRQRELSAATDANASIHARLLDARARYRADPDYPTLVPRWTEESGKIVDDGLAGIDNARLREHVRNTVGVSLAREGASIEGQVFDSAATAHAAYRRQCLQNLVQHTSPDPSDPLTAGATDAFHATIDDAVARGFVSPQEALAEKRQAALTLCTAHYTQMGRADPARAIGELESPDCPHPVAQFLPAPTRNGLIAQANANQQAQALDAERAPFLAEHQAKCASDEAEGSIVNDLLGANPTTTAADIVNNAKLAPEAQNRLFGMAARTMQQDPPAQVSAANALALLDRIRRPDGDPNRIADKAPLVMAFNARDLSGTDFQYTLKQLAQAQSSEGAPFAARQQTLFKDVAFLVGAGAPSDPDRAGAPDLAAAARLYQFDRDIDRQADRYRAEGKDPLDLFDPSKPDYVGSAARLLPYVESTPVQLAADSGQPPTAEAKSADTPEPTLGPNDTTALPTAEGENREPTDAASAEIARQVAAARQRDSLIHHGEGTATDLIPVIAPVLMAAALLSRAGPAAAPTLLPVLIRQFGPAALRQIWRFLETTDGLRSRISGLRDVLLGLLKPPTEEATHPPEPGAPADPSSSDQPAQSQSQPREATADELRALTKRAREIHDSLDPIARSRRTTAVLSTDGDTIVASGGKDLTPLQRNRLGPHETPAKLPKAHAEQTALREAQESGFRPRALVSSRRFCPQCIEVIQSSGGRLTSPNTAVFSP